MDRDTRNAIQRATQSARALLEREVGQQLEGVYDIRIDGTIPSEPGAHLDEAQRLTREKLVAAVSHYAAFGRTRAEAVSDYLRESAFTTLNRFVALKMLEARELVQECISRGDQSAGFREFCGLAPGLVQLPDQGYRLYLESIFDEIGQEVGILFDRRDPSTLIWPRRQVLSDLLAVLNAPGLAFVWGDDETIGWVYQYFNNDDDRRRARYDSDGKPKAPQNSHDLAVRNQFFTPRYVVQFLADNTLGKLWLESCGHESRLVERCEYLARPFSEADQPRSKKDPRDLKVLDPACGSGHFLLYSFDLLLAIYAEAWERGDSGVRSTATGRTLRDDYPDITALRTAAPALILEHNLYGIDIDPRCVQIAALALWLRAQRAWKQDGVPVSGRPRIRRTHIVVAEPMPGDAALVEEFASQLDPPLLRDLFRKMVTEMQRAGDLGTLLRPEEGISTELRRAREQFVEQRQSHLPGLEPLPRQDELDLSGIDDDEFFHEGEVRIVEALRRFAESASGGPSVRRRLFADDATQGIAFIDLVRTAFDVVLMNPPFGEIPSGVQAVIDKQYPEARNDIYAAFVRRGTELVRHCDGYVGAVTSRAFTTGRDHRNFRRSLLADTTALTLFLDLGPGVLDSAMVETAAYVLGPPAGEHVRFIDARQVHKASASSSILNAPAVDWPSTRFLALPQADLLYDLDASAFSELTAGGTTFEPGIGRVTFGLTTKDDFRFVRLRWEVSPGDIEKDGPWVPFAKGGEYSWFTSDLHLVVNRREGGSELAAFAESRDGNVASTRRSSSSYFRPGICFSRRSQKGFSARRLRSHACFSDKSGVIIPTEADSPWLYALPFVLASREFQKLISAHSKFGSYEIGPIKNLPIPNAAAYEQRDRWAAIYRICDELEQWDELSETFVSPPRDARRATEVLRIVEEELDAGLRACGLSPDQGVMTRSLIAEDLITCHAVPALSWLSWAVGAAFGRFDIRFATGVRPRPGDLGFFDAPPVCPPGMLTGDDGLPVTSAPPGYPLAFPENGILVDDPGHPADLTNAVRAVVDEVFGDSADQWWQEASATLAPKDHDLRAWLASSFFDHHLKRHSRSRRKAPIIWQLGIPSGRYSVWLYVHRLNADSLFRLQHDVIAPKLAYEERQLTSLTQGSSGRSSAKERREMEAQEAFVAELRALLEEVKRVAPLWKPILDDGIVLVMAPLWRLVAHKAWQRELKAKWAELAAGAYDWAQLAMHLWPERVVLKCAEDRSLAIAHGLDDVFWVEDENGRWVRREEPTAAVEDLIRERTSAATKDALRTAA
jgi:hypothetical protein